MISSKYGIAHPPCSNPPLLSSSGWPGPCITPSSDSCSLMISFRTMAPPSGPSDAPSHNPLTLASRKMQGPVEPATNSSDGLLTNQFAFKTIKDHLEAELEAVL